MRNGVLSLASMALALLLGSWVASAALPGAQNPASAATEERPNILFVLTDDLAASDLRMLSGLNDTLVREGLTFENAFATGTICCPSRVSILRGQYIHNHKIYTSKAPSGGEEKFRKSGRDRSTIGTWLRAAPAAYKTAYYGKYLNGYKGDRARYVPPGWNEWHGYVGQYRKGPYKINNNGKIREYAENTHDTDVLRDMALNFLRRTKDDTRPFFLFFNTNAPHAPSHAPPRHHGEFKDAKLPRSPSFNEADVDDKPGWVRRLPLLTERQMTSLENRYQGRLRSMLSVEEALSSFIETLEAQGRLDNTYVVFASDQGFHLGEHRMEAGKRSVYEEDIRIPLIIRGPGVPAGESVEHMAITNDLAPTFARLAGAKVPDFVDGRSLVPVLGAARPPLGEWRQAALTENFALDPDGHNSFIPSYSALRMTNRVYTRYKTGEHEFYDLTEDPYQLENSHDAEDPALMADMETRLNELKVCKGGTCRTAENAPAP